MSLFSGKKGLKHQFAEVAFDNATLATAVAPASSMLFMVMELGPKYKLFIDNQMDCEIAILVEHPEAFKEPEYAGSPADYRLLLTKVSQNQTLNYSVGESPQIQFDTGTKVYIYVDGAAPSSGKLKLSSW